MGMCLNHWMPDFDPEVDILSTIIVWVRLPHLPLHCWGDNALKCICDTLDKYIDKSYPKMSMYTWERIC
jgi:hypothetical protein